MRITLKLLSTTTALLAGCNFTIAAALGNKKGTVTLTSTIPPVAETTTLTTSIISISVSTAPSAEAIAITQTDTISVLVTVTQTNASTLTQTITQIPQATSSLSSSSLIALNATATPSTVVSTLSVPVAAPGVTQGAGVVAGTTSPPTFSPIVESKRGPFTPRNGVIGEVPTLSVDVPITIIFMILFMSGAAYHLIRHEINSKKGHNFLLSDLVFDFCMVRTITSIMRIVWAFKPNNNSVVLAAQIFENAGVVVLFAVNIVLTQRILRATHPHVGWNPIVSKVFIGLLASIPIIIIYNIILLTLAFFFLDPKKLTLIRGFSFFGVFYTLFLSLIPVILVPLSILMPSRSQPENFGIRPLHVKTTYVQIVALMLVVGAVIRTAGATNVAPVQTPLPIDDKTLFYVTGFLLEIMVVYMHAFLRFDLLFHVPDGASAPGDYSRKAPRGASDDEEKLFGDINVGFRASFNTLIDLDARPSGSGMSAREEIGYAVMEVERLTGFQAKTIDLGDSNTILYAFRVPAATRNKVFPPWPEPVKLPAWAGDDEVIDEKRPASYGPI